MKAATRLMIMILALAMGTSGFAETADTVAINGKIFTMNEKQPWAEAVAIKGTDIVYVGDNEGAKAFIGKNTTVGDLKGKMMLPGFIDTHMHMLPMMVFSGGLVMPNEGDPKKMLAQLKDYVANNPDGPFYSFGGAFEGTVPITRQEIDAIIKDKPFLMMGQGGHGGWANTKALEMSGIEADKEDPVDYWGRDENGQLTGEVGTSPAIWLMVKKLNIIKKEAVLRSAEKILKVASQNGVTTSFEAATFEGSAEGVFSAVSELEKSGKLTTRIIAGPMIQRDYHVKGALAELKKFGPMYSSDLFNVNFLKIHGDGSPDNRTAKMLLPYKDPSKDAGFVALKPDELKEVMMTAAGWGYNIHTHTCGDGAVRWALDGFEAVRKAGYKGVRLNTGHTMFMDPTDAPRYKELNVGADSIIAQGYALPTTYAVLTEEQKKRYMPVKSLIDLGVRVGFSSDYPVFPEEPFRNIYIAMTRCEPGKKNCATETLNERVDLETALKGYTVNSAYMVGMEDKIGSIEVGKKADLIVIDRNLFEIPVEEIPETNVLATMMDGRIVHEEAVDWEPSQEWRSIDIYGYHGKAQ
jgi:predicted amidohydrolase YtcJ